MSPGVPSEVRYARSGEISIAYQTLGNGPIDVIMAPGFPSHLEIAWQQPRIAHFYRRLATFSRLILMDRRGTGLSDPVSHLPTLEERMDDVRAVLDAAGSERAFLMGISESGPMCTLLAATHPERTAGLVLCNTFACGRHAADYPWAMSSSALHEWARVVEEQWGTGITATVFAPSRADVMK